MENYEVGGKEAAIRYYCADFLFILFFGGIQVLLIRGAFGKKILSERKWISFGIVSVPFMRGIFDIFENVLLLITTMNYPKISENMVIIASAFTRGKIACIYIWGVMLVVGLISRVIYKIICKRRGDE